MPDQSSKTSRHYTDNWGAYERYLDAERHKMGKQTTHKIERKNLNLRAWIKRLARKTICFFKTRADTRHGYRIAYQQGRVP